VLLGQIVHAGQKVLTGTRGNRTQASGVESITAESVGLEEGGIVAELAVQLKYSSGSTKAENREAMLGGVWWKGWSK